MLQFTLRRILYMVPTLIIVSILSFAIIQLPPGDYLTSHIAALAEGGDIVDQDEIEALKRRYGLDQPVYVQYFKWIWNFIQGEPGSNFPTSISHLEFVLCAAHHGISLLLMRESGSTSPSLGHTG